MMCEIESGFINQNKCAACGYEYDERAKKMRRETDGHGGAYTVGPLAFLPLCRPPQPQCSELLECDDFVLSACPMCGTVKAE